MNALDGAFFRHEYGRLVSTLSRRFGVQHLEGIEDAVQFALTQALETWPVSRVPDNPAAWLFRVAHNQLVQELRQRVRREQLIVGAGEPEAGEAPQTFLVGDVRDDLLRMLFACCDEALPVESQLILALKVLCGFDVREISQRLFISEANVYKRLTRARERLQASHFQLESLSLEALASRRAVVHSILYVLFTEGYLSSHAEGALRRELCDDAIRLTAELARHPAGATTETFALLALMYLHRARMAARDDGTGGLLLLEEQDRTLWDVTDIALGLQWLARSAEGDSFSRYHAEAGIAAEHCVAPSFAQTRWQRIVECYELLERLAPSALHTLNRAVALAEWKGPEAGLGLLEGLAPPSWLEGSYQWSAVLADLHRRAGNHSLAQRHRAVALASAPSQVVRATLERRLRER